MEKDDALPDETTEDTLEMKVGRQNVQIYILLYQI